MQNTAVQMTNRRALRESLLDSNLPAMSRRRDDDSSECADPFLQIIMGMVNQLQENGDAKAQDTSGMIASADSLIAFMQNPQSLSDLLKLLDLGNTQADGTGNQESGIDLHAFGKSIPQLPQLLQLLTEHPEFVKTDTADGQLFAQLMNQGKTQAANEPANLMSYEAFNLTSDKPISSAVYAVGTDNADSLSTEKTFSDAIAKVREMLSTAKTDVEGGNKETIDVDKLQNEVIQNKVSNPFEMSFKNVSKTSDPKLLDQITTGIKQNLTLGKTEFTVKLKPEALGEITIKIVEEAGKSTLSITTASLQTAKLINSDLVALKEAVAPMNVHVNEAVMQTNEAQQGTMQQYNMAGQQFAGQQFAGQQSFTRFANSAYGSSEDSFFADASNEMQSISGRVVSDRLDAYI
jgi:hypothetical protein